MAKKRKVAARPAAKKKVAKRVVIKTKGASSRGVKRKAPVKAKRVKASKSVIGRVVDAVKEAASLRTRLEGHNTFED